MDYDANQLPFVQGAALRCATRMSGKLPGTLHLTSEKEKQNGQRQTRYVQNVYLPLNSQRDAGGST